MEIKIKIKTSSKGKLLDRFNVCLFPCCRAHLLASMLFPLNESMLALMELVELLRRLSRCAEGSMGLRPVALAKRLRMSVRDMTPVSLPDMRAPIMAAAGTDGALWGEGGAPAPLLLEGAGGAGPPAVTKLPGPVRGVAGVLGEGDADSTIHMRCEPVATSLATV